MQVIRKNDLQNTGRHIQNELYNTTRFLLASDNAGATVTDNVLAPDIEEVYGYDHHTEIAYCIEGEALITDAAGDRHTMLPGTMLVSRPGERFRLLASKPTRVICVFTPPLNGGETGFAKDMESPSPVLKG